MSQMTYDNEGNLVPLKSFSIGGNYLNTSTMPSVRNDLDPMSLAFANSSGFNQGNFNVGPTAGSNTEKTDAAYNKNYNLNPVDSTGPVSTSGFMSGGFIPNFIKDTSDKVDGLKDKFPRLNNLFSLGGDNEMLMNMMSNIGSAEFDDEGEMTNPGKGLFGREGGFMSKFGTGEGALSNLFNPKEGEFDFQSSLGKGFSSIGKGLLGQSYEFTSPFSPNRR